MPWLVSCVKNIQFGKGSLVFGKNVVAYKNRLCRRLGHSPHQSHIKHEKLEGIMIFIELERQTWSIIEFVVPFKDIKPFLLPEVQKLVK